MNLDQTQALFFAAVTQPDTVASAALEGAFRPSRSRTAAQRLHTYASMFVWRQVDALREDFPRLADLLGEEAFVELCRAYVLGVPSTEPDLGLRGRLLPDFVRAHPSLAGRPDAAALAALEWARAEVFTRAAAPPLEGAALASLGDALTQARLLLAPTLCCLTLDFEVAGLWRALESGEAPPPPQPGRAAVAVWRPEFDVVHAQLALEECQALEAVRGGASLGAALEAFSGRASAGEVALTALRSWLAEGWVTGLR